MLQCDQKERSATVAPNCTTSTDLKKCLASLSDDDVMLYALYFTTSAQICTHYAAPRSVTGLFSEMWDKVSKSFKFSSDINMNSTQIGKNIISNFLPVYHDEFKQTQFTLYPLFFLVASVVGWKNGAHLIVLATFLFEIIIVFFDGTAFGSFLCLISHDCHWTALAIRYVAFTSFWWGYGHEYSYLIFYLIFFIPNLTLSIIEMTKANYDSKTFFDRDKRGRFSKK